MVDLAVAFWFSAAVTCHISVSELGERPSSVLHPIWLQGAISLVFLPYKKPCPRILADEGLLQSVHWFVLLSGLHVQKTRGTRVASRGMMPGVRRLQDQQALQQSVALAIQSGVSWLRVTPDLALAGSLNSPASS